MNPKELEQNIRLLLQEPLVDAELREQLEKRCRRGFLFRVHLVVRPRVVSPKTGSKNVSRGVMELNRHTRVAGLFPNEASLLRLVSALLAETSEEWETGKIYPNMDNQNPTFISIC